MTTDLITLTPHTDLASADAIMKLKHLRHLPVVDNGTLRGIVTHRDILHARVSSTVDLSPRESVHLIHRIHAEDIMHREVATVSPDTSIEEAGNLMLTHKFGCLPVVHEDQLVGIITEVDLLSFLMTLLGHL